MVQADGLYAFDRGYADYGLFQELHDLLYGFIGRVQANAADEVQEEPPSQRQPRLCCAGWAPPTTPDRCPSRSVSC
jgi:hypothetical protein